jgi:DNA-binding transcriptional regulator YiaG
MPGGQRHLASTVAHGAAGRTRGSPGRGTGARSKHTYAGHILNMIRMDWRRLAAAIRADPWGPVAHQVLEAVHLSHPYGTTELLEGVVARARKLAADSERADVASEVRALVARSGRSRQDFAERIGTSRSRLSTYMSGQVVPSAALMVRMRRVALHASEMTPRRAAP